MADNVQQRIQASHAYNLAVAFFQASNAKLNIKDKKAFDAALGNIDILAEHFYPKVEQLIAKMEKGVTQAPEASEPASEKSIKYLYSLIRQNSYGKLKSEEDIGYFLAAHVEDKDNINQAEVSKLIDNIKNDKQYIPDWLNDVSDYRPEDSGEQPTDDSEKAKE